MAAMFVNRWGGNQQSVQRTFHRCFLPSFDSFGKVVSEENISRNRPIRNKNCLWWPCLLTNRDEISNLYPRPYNDASYQISVYLGKQFQRRRFFRNQSIRNKNGLWWPCLLTDRDEMSHLYRGLSINALYQVSFFLAKRFQRRRFKKIGQSETIIACGGHVCKQIGTKCVIFREKLPQMLPTKFQFIWLRGFRGQD